jgi:hypothetical protein
MHDCMTEIAAPSPQAVANGSSPTVSCAAFADARQHDGHAAAPKRKLVVGAFVTEGADHGGG